MSAAKINSDLQSLINWSIQWLMITNALKTLVLTLTRKRKLLHHQHLTINGVEEVNQHCLLGLVIKKSLTWENHINYILGKTEKIVNIMRCLKYTLYILFINRIRPIIEYADAIYIIIQVNEQLPSGTLVCVSECHSYLFIFFPSALLSLLDAPVA